MERLRAELKSLFTGYWEYLALHSACELNLFDLIIGGFNTLDSLQKKINADEKNLRLLLDVLMNKNFVIIKDNKINLTKKAEYLTENNSMTLKNACILWGMDHMNAWQSLTSTIKTGEPVFDNYFDFISNKPYKLKNYHKAMNEYAIEDYQNITEIINLDDCNRIMDVGGGLGALITSIKDSYPEKEYFLFEKPEVLELTEIDNVNLIKGNFFEKIPSLADCIILSRVIHDWEDKKAKNILNNCYNALPKNGSLVLIENFADKLNDNAALLSLNMALICKSYERTELEYLSLLQQTNFKIVEIKQMNQLQWIIKTKI